MVDDQTLLKTLTVETLRVYNFILKQNPKEVTLEGLSQALNLKKPTILHHLEKLKRIDLVEQTLDGYKVKEIVTVNIIKGYTSRLRKMLTTWVPIMTFFFFFLINSLFMMEPIGLKAIGVLLSLFGIVLSVREIKRIL